MILLLLFIFMNSRYLAQCEMMGHSLATRGAGSEFRITPRTPPLLHLPLFSPNIPHLDLLNMDGGGGLGKRGKMVQRKNISLTEVALVTSFSPTEMWHKN